MSFKLKKQNKIQRILDCLLGERKDVKDELLELDAVVLAGLLEQAVRLVNVRYLLLGDVMSQLVLVIACCTTNTHTQF